MAFEAKKGDVVGAYYIQKKLSNGGMAYVVLASSRQKEYALKMTKVSSDQETTIAGWAAKNSSAHP